MSLLFKSLARKAHISSPKSFLSAHKPSHFLIFWAYSCLASNKHTKSKLSLFKFFLDFPDALMADACWIVCNCSYCTDASTFSFNLKVSNMLITVVFLDDNEVELITIYGKSNGKWEDKMLNSSFATKYSLFQPKQGSQTKQKIRCTKVIGRRYQISRDPKLAEAQIFTGHKLTTKVAELCRHSSCYTQELGEITKPKSLPVKLLSSEL